MKLTSFLVATVPLVVADSEGIKAEGGSGTGGEVSTEDTFWGGNCDGELNLPFMVTNLEPLGPAGEHWFTFRGTDTASETQFLKDVRYCPDGGLFGEWRIYADVVSPEEFKAAVEEEVSTNDQIDHVMFNIHGWSVDPEASFMMGYLFMEEHAETTGYLWIPVSWRSEWARPFVDYDIDRNTHAIEAGKTFAASLDAFKLSVPTSLMAHSMGNWVTRVIAQNAVEPEIVFENVFMVAADARMDMFSTDFNPAAPQATKTQGKADQAEVHLGIPEDELRENGGYAITQIANHVHVLWNIWDPALHFRELFQVGFGDNVRKALGKFGHQSEELTDLSYFQERVTYHDFSFEGFDHNYHLNQDSINVYAEFKSSRKTASTTGGFNMLRAKAHVN